MTETQLIFILFGLTLYRVATHFKPDLLPIDLKRQGRAEVHVPLFYQTPLTRQQPDRRNVITQPMDVFA